VTRRRVRLDVERLTDGLAMLARLLRMAATALLEVAALLDRLVAAAGFPVAAPEGSPAGRGASAAATAAPSSREGEAQGGPPLRVVPTLVDPRDDVRAALEALGYPAREARRMVDGLPGEGRVEDLLREALTRSA
jgi:hypothetical protein